MENNRIVVGIDLGTTNTLACYFKKGKPSFIRFPGSGSMLPSVLYVDEDGTLSVGEKANRRGIVDPKNEIRSSKTYMGDTNKTWTCNGKTFSPTDAAELILREVKRCIIKKMKCAEDTQIDAVITIPAYFNSNQTDETRKAGERAGFNVMQIITEPMAAAITAVKEIGMDKKVLVVDLGGGTFDLSVLEADNSTSTYTAIDISGDRRLGGDDFDNAVMGYLINIIEDDLGIDLTDYKTAGIDEDEYNSAMGRIREEANKAKEELSDAQETDVDIENIFSYGGSQYSLNISLSRDDFEVECKPLFDKISDRIKTFVNGNSKFKLSDISQVVLAGGSCYIPKIQQIVENIVNKPINTELDFSTLVAKGACLFADSGSSGMAIKIQDILSHSLGISIVKKGGDKLVLSKLLNKGDAYPCSNTQQYTTVYDNQPTITIDVYEAGSDCEDIENIEAHDFYGGFDLNGIAPAPAGEPVIDVTFSYDKSRCLTVEAVDRASGIRKQIEIQKGAKPLEAPKAAPIDFALLIDTSGSMRFDNGLTDAISASKALFDEMIDLDVHRLSLIPFSDGAEVLSHLSHDRAALKSKVDYMSAGGGTNMIRALKAAYEELRDSQNERVVIMVTDGYPNSTTGTLSYANELKNNNIRLIAIGAGSDIRFGFLRDLASPGDAYKIDNMSELRDTFKQVISKITQK